MRAVTDGMECNKINKLYKRMFADASACKLNDDLVSSHADHHGWHDT
jgi:hypothetical protein